MSRLIVKNIPKFAREKELTAHFGKMGEITDCKIAESNGVSRRFCFIGSVCLDAGFKTAEEALGAQKYFNGTYFGTSKIQVELAKSKDELLVQAAAPSKIQRNSRKQEKAAGTEDP